MQKSLLYLWVPLTRYSVCCATTLSFFTCRITDSFGVYLIFKAFVLTKRFCQVFRQYLSVAWVLLVCFMQPLTVLNECVCPNIVVLIPKMALLGQSDESQRKAAASQHTECKFENKTIKKTWCTSGGKGQFHPINECIFEVCLACGQRLIFKSL